MTRDLIESYKHIFKDNRIVLDSYKLANGFYYLIKKDGTFEKLVVNKESNNNSELYEYLKMRDFYSIYLNSNKSIDTTLKKTINGKSYNMLKKIASTNIYTLFFKNKSVKGIANENDEKDSLPVDLFKEGIIKYYDSLYRLVGNKDKDNYKKEEIECNCKIMQEAFDTVVDDLINNDKPKDTWVKIFLDNTEEEYERVNRYYISQKIFNTDKNNIKVDGNIFGINNYNFNMNSKKPYLELKTTTYKIASLISTEDIIVLRRIYIWLYNNVVQQSNSKIPLDFDFNGIGEESEYENQDIYEIKVINDNGNAKIDNFEYIPNFTTNIRRFDYKDILHNKNEVIQSTSNIYGLEWLINNIWITHNMKSETNYLRNSYYDYDEKIAKSKGLSNWKKDFLGKYSNVFKDLFKKENKMLFIQNLYKIGVEVVQNTLIDDYEYKKNFRGNAVSAMNLWLCLEEYFSKKEVKRMKVNDIQERCKKIFENYEKIENDDEYYFLVGQITYFLLSKSKASKLTQDITEPIIKANNVKVLNKELKYLYDKYNYDISFKDKRFNNIYSQILLANPESSVKENKDIILAGILSDNMFYIKKNGGNEDENE